VTARHPGHVVAAACFAVLSVLRGLEGDVAWAAVFVLAAASQVWLATRSGPPPRLTRSGRVVSPAARARRHRTWRTLTLAAVPLPLLVAVLAPPLALIAAVPLAACLVGLHRSRPASPRSPA